MARIPSSVLDKAGGEVKASHSREIRIYNTVLKVYDNKNIRI